MKRSLAFTAAALAAFAVHVAVASAGCVAGGSNAYYYAGFEKNQIVADGDKLNAKITFNSGTYYGNGSHISAWDGVSNDARTSWVQAGIDDEAAYGRTLYVEYQNTSYHFLHPETPVIGQAYTALVEKVSAGVWDAVTGSHGYDNLSISGMQYSAFVGESYTGTTTCNAMSYDFASVVPWDTSQFDFEYNNEGPYTVSNKTSNGWTSSG